MSQEVQIPHNPKMNYAAKVMSLGVFAKAVLMAAIITLLGATTFTQSIILVLVSATATGIFALLVVLIQVHSERSLHDRIDKVQSQIDYKTQEIKTQAESISETTQAIAGAVTPSNGESK